MKRNRAAIFLYLIVFSCVVYANLYTFQAIDGSPTIDGDPNGRIEIYDQRGKMIKEIQVYGYSETSILYQNDDVLFVVSNTDAKESGSTLLYPLYRINLANGNIEIVDYCTQNAIVSSDEKYVLFESGNDKDRSVLILKEIGSSTIIWSVPAKAFKATGFGVGVKRTENGCIVSYYEEDGYLEVSFDTLTYKVLNDYHP